MRCHILLSAILAVASGIDIELPFEGEVRVIRANSSFYAIATSTSGGQNLPNLYKSSDLYRWDRVGSLLESPSYINITSDFSPNPKSPSIFQSNTGEIRLFYSRFHTPSDSYYGAAAYALSLEGPYHPLNWPLFDNYGENVRTPFAYEFNGTNYIYYAAYKSGEMQVRILNNDLFGVSSDLVYRVIKQDFGTSYPCIINKNETFYLFYTQNNATRTFINVARSTHPTGPFEFLTATDNNNLLISNAITPSVLQNVDGEDVIVYSSLEGDVITAKTIGWNKAGWPFVTSSTSEETPRKKGYISGEKNNG